MELSISGVIREIYVWKKKTFLFLMLIYVSHFSLWSHLNKNPLQEKIQKDLKRKGIDFCVLSFQSCVGSFPSVCN